ncbi:hypothetical protein [Hymenobacter coalescens]
MTTKNLVRPALATAGLLLVPFVAMQFTPEVKWTLSDFVFAGLLIFSTGLAYELLASRAGNLTYRLGVVLALAAGFLSIWVNLAVGIIGAGPNLANVLFAGVYVTAIVGAIMARLQPRGMANTMFAAALVQFLVPVVALLIWRPELTTDVTRGALGNLLFVALWIGSALLFRRADGHRDSSRPAASTTA